MSARAWRRGLVALCALCLAGAMTSAVAAAPSTAKQRHLAKQRHPSKQRHPAKRSCQRRRRNKHKRCPAAQRRKSAGTPARRSAGRGAPNAPSNSPGAGAISGALNTSGGIGGNVGGAENPPREVPPVQEPGPGSEAPRGPAHLQVSAKEFSLTLSRPATPGGRLQLELVNAGQDEHNLHIRPAAGGPDVGAVGIVLPGHHADVEFQLKPGTYTLYCAIPAHEELGMKATLTVQ
ncbi:MAG TPA: cupredoxin domain-containing protein [Solirubrobacteraceae bacterium]